MTRTTFTTTATAALAILVASAAPSSAWTPDGVPVCRPAGDQNEVIAVSDGAGGTVLAWRDNRSGNLDVYAQRLDAAGEPLWGPDGLAVYAGASAQYFTSLALVDPEAVVVVWEDVRSGNSDIYAQKVSLSGARLWAADGVPVCTMSGTQQYARTMADGAGGAFIVWADSRTAGNEDIYAQRLSHDGTAQWTAQGVNVSGWSGNQSLPRLASDGLGGLFVVWQDGRNPYSIIYAQRLQDDGALMWVAGGVQISTYSPMYNRISPQIVEDGATGAVIAWCTSGLGTLTISAQRITRTGTVLWAAGGVVMFTTGLPYADNPQIASAGDGGAIVVWRDARNYNNDVYAQRVSSTGVIMWGAPGLAICDALGHQQGARVVADGDGGAVVTWYDQRGANADIYVQQVDANGAARWTADGFALCAADGDQTYPYPATLATGNELVAWWDARSGGGGGTDIFALPTPLCRIEPDQLDFGQVHAFRDSTLVISNDGGGVVSGNVSESCDHFAVLAGGGPFSLGVGEQLAVTVRFEPTSGGTHACTLDTGLGGCADVQLTGDGVDPSCLVAPASLDFGSVTIGHHADLPFIVTNQGGCRLTGSVDAPAGPFSLVQGAGPFDLGHGDTLEVVVRFTPVAAGTATAAVSAGVACPGVACSGVGDRVPRLHAVRDVPGDQGGLLDLSWHASPGDDAQQRLITRYTVWRAITATEAARLRAAGPEPRDLRVESLDGRVFYWRLISSLDAYFLTGYAEAVPTLFDSTAVCDDLTYVQILAHTADPAVFWASPPDSARSVDNLAPALPRGLAGRAQFDPARLDLAWHPNAEADLDRYELFRGTGPDFPVGEASLVASLRDTLWTDASWEAGGGFHYKLAGVDVHGNRGTAALLRPQDITGAGPGTPAVPFVLESYPNPFNPSTRIRFGLPAASRIRLSVYDQMGRLVRDLAAMTRPAGWQELVWDGRDGRGRDAASGSYVVKLSTAQGVRSIKVTLAR